MTGQMESRFEGSVLGYIGYTLAAFLITVCTFGIAFP